MKKLAVFLTLSAVALLASAESSTPNSGEISLTIAGELKGVQAFDNIVLYKNNQICASVQKVINAGENGGLWYGPGEAYCQNGVDKIFINFGNRSVQYKNTLNPDLDSYCWADLFMSSPTSIDNHISPTCGEVHKARKS